MSTAAESGTSTSMLESDAKAKALLGDGLEMREDEDHDDDDDDDDEGSEEAKHEALIPRKKSAMTTSTSTTTTSTTTLTTASSLSCLPIVAEVSASFSWQAVGNPEEDHGVHPHQKRQKQTKAHPQAQPQTQPPQRQPRQRQLPQRQPPQRQRRPQPQPPQRQQPSSVPLSTASTKTAAAAAAAAATTTTKTTTTAHARTAGISNSQSSKVQSSPRPTTTTTTTTSISSPCSTTALDFIGPSRAFKSLFSVPYATDREVNLAIHNLGGSSLLIDSGDHPLLGTSTAEQEGIEGGSGERHDDFFGIHRQPHRRLRRNTSTHVRRKRRRQTNQLDSNRRVVEDRTTTETPTETATATEASPSSSPSSPAPQLVPLPYPSHHHHHHHHHPFPQARHSEDPSDHDENSKALAVVTSMLQKTTLHHHQHHQHRRPQHHHHHHHHNNEARSSSIRTLSSLQPHPADSASSTSTSCNHEEEEEEEEEEQVQQEQEQEQDKKTKLTSTTPKSKSGRSSHDPETTPPSFSSFPSPPPPYMPTSTSTAISHPRQYLDWRFRDLRMLVGSDAIIFRLPPSPNSPSSSSSSSSSATKTNPSTSASPSNADALVVSFAEAPELRALLQQHRDMQTRGDILTDYQQLALLEQRLQEKKLSYAQILNGGITKSTATASTPPTTTTTTTTPSPSPVVAHDGRQSKGGDFLFSPKDAADHKMRLPTVIVPSASTSPLGAGFSVAPMDPTGGAAGMARSSASYDASSGAATSAPPNSDARMSSAPVCTVIDAYLDNIMANVPQLALCLREKGFVQSVRLLETDQIPTHFLSASSVPDSTVSGPSVKGVSGDGCTEEDPIFSPQIMEANAATLLRFLKANCTRDNSTYLLRREAGGTSVQLYDVSAISEQRQRKWKWWLAMISYRFALRLGHFTQERQQQQQQQQQNQSPQQQPSPPPHNNWNFMDAAQKRAFRARRRNLLQNALQLLQEVAEMDGEAHEIIRADICEHLAETFLNAHSVANDEETISSPSNDGTSGGGGGSGSGGGLNPTVAKGDGKRGQAPCAAILAPPYENLSVDALTKAHDYLSTGMRELIPLLEKTKALLEKSQQSDDDFNPAAASLEVETISVQLLGLNEKLINVLLRLAEHHLNSYWSSSAMQTLRNAARRISESISIYQSLEIDGENFEGEAAFALPYQLIWLYEHCGHFARSFAADELWRDRGHACGDDVISVLRDVEAAFSSHDRDLAEPFLVALANSPLTRKTRGHVSLDSISAVIAPLDGDDTRDESILLVVEKAKVLLNRQGQIQRDKRHSLVAACVCYSRALATLVGSSPQAQDFFDAVRSESVDAKSREYAPIRHVHSMLQKLQGDACNEIGKLLLNQVKYNLGLGAESSKGDLVTIEVLLRSADFWFEEGIEAFRACEDARNIALLLCNRCQCCKLRANSNFASSDESVNGVKSHSERCLQEAIDHLHKAHEALDQRDVDALRWDMVSQELAATYLVLGVRRRQALLGSGSVPILAQALRLNPGKERSIIHPMEKALTIYQELRNEHQTAATHYQLALFYSKVWTCQRDEGKTREKLASAFRHYGSAHSYFAQAPSGTEPTFVVLCLDLANLYAAVSGEECLLKALDRCLETAPAFSSSAVASARTTESKDEGHAWMEKMTTLMESIEDRMIKLLMSLAKIERESGANHSRYKDLYKAALTSSLELKSRSMDDPATKVEAFHSFLQIVISRRSKISLD